MNESFNNGELRRAVVTVRMGSIFVEEGSEFRAAMRMLADYTEATLNRSDEIEDAP